MRKFNIRRFMKRCTQGTLFLLATLPTLTANGQTVLINPALGGGFEMGTGFTANGWTVVNGSASNQWYTGTVPSGFTNNSAYISSDAGVTNDYTNTSSVVHFYQDITFPAGETSIGLSFDWHALGESGFYDAIIVSLAPTSYTPTVGTSSLGTSNLGSPTVELGRFWNNSATQTANLAVPASVVGNCSAPATWRLIFTWKNDGSGGSNPSAAIDNISLASSVSTITSAGGIFTIDNTQPLSASNFPNFTSAIAALNGATACGPLASPVTFNVAAGQTFNELPPVITATGSASTQITFQKNGAGANPVIISTGTSSSSDGSLIVSGGDYFIFDGIDINNSASAAMEYGYILRNASATDGAKNNTIKNTSIQLNRTNSSSYASGIAISASSSYGGGTTPSSATGSNDNNQLINISINGAAAYGISVYGSSSYPDNGNSISSETGIRNTITNVGPTSSTYISAAGINTNAQSGMTITNTDVSAITSNQAAAYGIVMKNAFGNCTINTNSVYNVSNQGSTSTSSVAYGINAQNNTTGTNNIQIVNNMVGNIYTSYTGSATSTRYAIGIFAGVSSASTSQSYDILHNTVSIGSGLTPTYSNTCFEIQNVAAIYTVQNNIFANFSNAQTGSARHYTWVSTSATRIGATGSLSDYNDLYVANDLGTSGFTGRGNTTDMASIQDWTAALTASAGTDLNSISGTPVFVDNNSDLHLNLGTSGTELESAGTTTSVTTDFDGDNRPGPAGSVNGGGTAPDLGADEFDGVPASAPSITFNTMSPAALQCVAVSHVISVDISNISGTITTVELNYDVNGTAQTPIAMSNTSGTTWEGTIPAPTPANATISWTVTATNSFSLSDTYTGTAYNDEPLYGATASVISSLNPVCEGSPVTLTADLAQPNVSITLGNGSSTTGTTEELTAFCNRRASYRMQTLYTAAELTAAGLHAGPITSIAYNITSIGDGASNSNFTVKVGTSALTALTDYLASGSFTTVFPAATFTHAIGWNTITFSTPYNWDGVSNLVIEVSYDGADALYNAQTYYNTTTSNMVAYGYNGATTGTLSTKRFNVIFQGVGAFPITSVSWSDGATTIGTSNPLTVNPTATTTYTATIESSGCTVTPSPSLTVTVNPLPSAPTAANSSQCGIQVPTASVTSTTGASTPTFNWYDAAASGTQVQSDVSTTYTTAISATTTFYVSEVDGTTGCESTRTPVTVTVITPDSISAMASSATICLGETVTLTSANTNATPVQSYSYSWLSTTNSGAETSTSGASITVTPTDAGTYTYTVTAVDGACTEINDVTVLVNASPTNAVATVSSATVCNGTTVDLDVTASANASTPFSYNEDFESWPPTDWTFINAGSGNDWNTSSTANTGSGSMYYAYNSSSAANAWAMSAPQTLLAGTTYTLTFWYKVQSSTFPEKLKVTVGNAATVAAQTNVLWDNNGGSDLSNTTWAQATITYTPSTSGTYYFGFNCYSVADQYNLYVDDIAITGTESPLTYSWTSAPAGFTSTAQSPSDTPASSLDYNVSVSNLFGCSASATVSVMVNQPSVSSETQTACESFTWPVNGGQYFSSGTYTDTLVNAVGCDSIITLNLTINNNAMSTDVQTACESYTWIDGNTYFASNNTATFTISGGAASGCDSIITLDLTILTPPTATATDNGDGTITASNGTTYAWIDCATNTPVSGATSQTFAPTMDGSYAVIISDGNCSDTSSCVLIDYLGIKNLSTITVQMIPNPTNDLVTIQMSVANASLEVLDAQGKLILTKEIISGEQVSLGAYETGIYFFNVRTANGIAVQRVVKN